MTEVGTHFSGDEALIAEQTPGNISDPVLIEALRLDCACSGESNVFGHLLSEGNAVSVTAEPTLAELRAEWMQTGHA